VTLIASLLLIVGRHAMSRSAPETRGDREESVEVRAPLKGPIHKEADDRVEQRIRAVRSTEPAQQIAPKTELARSTPGPSPVANQPAPTVAQTASEEIGAAHKRERGLASVMRTIRTKVDSFRLEQPDPAPSADAGSILP
jgi:hypothetical protein